MKPIVLATDGSASAFSATKLAIELAREAGARLNVVAAWQTPQTIYASAPMIAASDLEHALYACDEMSGFVTACSLVRPSKSVLDLEAASVMKRMKDKAFARAVSREDLRKGAEEIGLPIDQHITNVITFMRERADLLGLRGTL